MKKLKERSWRGYLHFFDCNLEIVLTNDISQSRNRPQRVKRLNGTYNSKYKAMVSHFATPEKKTEIVIFLMPKWLDHGIIAHECRHAADDMMWLKSIDTSKSGDCEVHATAQETITNLVYKQLKKWKARIR